jgi:soluble lytic murein transglycosylase-like protein
MACRRIAGRCLVIAGMLFCSTPNPTSVADYAPPRAGQIQKPADTVGVLFTAFSRCQQKLHEHERWRIAGAIHRESQRYGYDPLFVLAMVQVESACSPTARSSEGAVGLIQVKPSTARAVAEEAGLRWLGAAMLRKPVVNVQLGLRYLAHLEQRFQDPYLALAAYCLGPKRVRRMRRQRARHTAYVKKVIARYEDLLDEQLAARDHQQPG